ncbi:MAG: DNA repair protein RecO [Tepidiformaceae bacterium]
MSERPRTYTTEGVILRRRNLGEADTIFTVFSDREGKFDAVAKGVRKARSHMRGHLEPLTRSKLLIARGRSLDVFTQAETVKSYRAIRENLELGASAMYCSELVDRFAPEHVEQPGLYGLLLDVLDALEADAPPHVVRWFEMQLLSNLGYELQLDACAICSSKLPESDTLLSAAAGGFVCANCRGVSGGGRVLSVRAVKVLRFARSTDVSRFAALKMGEALTSEVQHALADVIRYLLDRDPATGRYVDQVARLPEKQPLTSNLVE